MQHHSQPECHMSVVLCVTSWCAGFRVFAIDGFREETRRWKSTPREQHCRSRAGSQLLGAWRPCLPRTAASQDSPRGRQRHWSRRHYVRCDRCAHGRAAAVEPKFLSLRSAVVYCRRTPVGVIRCRSSLRSVRTALENTILTAVSIVVQTGVVYTSEVVQ